MPSAVGQLTSLVQNLIQSVLNVFGAILGLFQNLLGAVLGIFNGILSAGVSLVAGIFNAFGSLVQSILGLVGGTIGVLWANIFLVILVGGGYYLYTNSQRNNRGLKKSA